MVPTKPDAMLGWCGRRYAGHSAGCYSTGPMESVPRAVATGLQGSLLDRLAMLTPVWNDTDMPLAYLITFRCYGTWLHGTSAVQSITFTIGTGRHTSSPTRGGIVTTLKRLRVSR